MEEPQRSCLDFKEEMDVAVMRKHGGRQLEPRSTSRPSFMVSKAVDAAVWGSLKDIRPPMHHGNPLSLGRFFE